MARSPSFTSTGPAGEDSDAFRFSDLVRVAGISTTRPLTATELVDRMGSWADAGSQHAICSLDRAELARLELIGRDVIPHIRGLGSPSPIP